MSYDFNVLVLNQKKPSKLSFNSKIEVLNEINDYSGKRYHSIWPFMTSMNGIWYSLVINDDGLRYAAFCESEIQEDEENLPIPYWIRKPNIISDFTQLFIKNEFSEDFKKIIKFLLNQSPTETIMILARYQGEDREVIQGVMSYDNYICLLEEGKILFNVCYIVRNK